MENSEVSKYPNLAYYLTLQSSLEMLSSGQEKDPTALGKNSVKLFLGAIIF